MTIPSIPDQGEAELITLEYDGKLIDVEYFDTDAQLMRGLERDGIKPKYESIAYCDTYDETHPKWGKLYLLKILDLGSVAHECMHLASGILARQGKKQFELTFGDASDLEEEFCELAGELAKLVLEDFTVPSLQTPEMKEDK